MQNNTNDLFQTICKSKCRVQNAERYARAIFSTFCLLFIYFPLSFCPCSSYTLLAVIPSPVKSVYYSDTSAFPAYENSEDCRKMHD